MKTVYECLVELVNATLPWEGLETIKDILESLKAEYDNSSPTEEEVTTWIKNGSYLPLYLNHQEVLEAVAPYPALALFMSISQNQSADFYEMIALAIIGEAEHPTL